MEEIKLITLRLPEEWLKFLDETVRAGMYPNRSEAIRIAIRDLLILYGSWPGSSTRTNKR